MAVICIGAMMSFVNVSATIGALTDIQRDLHASSAEVVWVSSAYSLVIAGGILTAGTLSDLFGRRRIFITGASLFLVGSIIASLSSTPLTLIGAQVVMGLGGAMILPAGLSIVSRLFVDPHQRTEAVSLWATSSGLGLVVGPVGAGLLLAHFGWNTVFMINLALSVVTVAGAVAFLPESRSVGRRIDPGGIILATLGMFALVYAIIEGKHLGYASLPILVTFAVAIGLIAAFVVYELRVDDPMLDMRLFTSASFSTVMGVAVVTMLAFTGMGFMGVFYLMQGQNFSALRASAVMLAMFVPFLIVSPLSAQLVRFTGFKRLLSAGLSIMGIGFLLLLLVESDFTIVAAWPGLVLIGLGAGLLLAPSTAAAVLSVDHERQGMASAAVNMFRQLGNVLGTSVLGTVLTAGYAQHLENRLRGDGLNADSASEVVHDVEQGSQTQNQSPHLTQLLDHNVPAAFTDSLHVGVVIAAVVVFLAVIPTAMFIDHRPGPKHDEVAE